MIDKRFTFKTKTRGNQAYTQWYDNEKPINSAHKVIDLLNELHEENRELKRHLDAMRSGALTDDKRIKELYEENEQLRQEKQLLYENIDLLKRFIENQGFKVKLDDKLFRVI